MKNKIDYNLVQDKSLFNCNTIKTVMMFCIILYHSTLFWKTDDFFSGSPANTSIFLRSLSDIIKGISCHIYVFMLISGYLFYYLKHENGKYNKFADFFKNKAKRLLIPYCFVAFFWAIPSAVFLLHFSKSQIVHRFLLVEAPNQLWYLVTSFGVFITFYVFYNFFEKYNYIGGCIVIILYFVGAICYHFFINIFTVWQIFQMFPFFWLGVKIRQYTMAFKRIPLLIWLTLHLGLFVVYMLQNQHNSGLLILLFNKIVEFMLYIIGSINIFLLGQLFFSKMKKKSKIASFISKRTMGIYLFHQQIIYLCLYFLNGRIHPCYIIIISVIASLIVPLIITCLLELHKTTRLLIGEK